MIIKRALSLLLVALVSGSAYAQDKQQKKALEEFFKQQKDKHFIVKVPMKLYKYDRQAWSGPAIYSCTIGQQESHLVIGGVQDWAAADFPLMTPLRYEKVNFTKEYTEVELRKEGLYAKLHFLPEVKDVQAAFSELTFSGSPVAFENTVYFKTKVFATQDPLIFPGVLTSVDYETKLDLLRKVSYTVKSIGLETYKGKNYFVRVYGEYSSSFNTIRMNQSARIAYVLKEQLLGEMKEYLKMIGNHPGLDGLKVTITLNYYNFLNKKDAGSDQVEIHTSFDLIKKFAEADITNQELVDGSIILVDGNRVKVSLEQSTS